MGCILPDRIHLKFPAVSVVMDQASFESLLIDFDCWLKLIKPVAA